MLKQSSDSIPKDGAEPVKTDDILSVSRFGIVPENGYITKPLTMIQKLNLIKKLIAELKYVVNIEESILQTQQFYWLSFLSIVDAKQQEDIKIALENHTKMPVRWLSNNEIEISISPESRIIKQRKIGINLFKNINKLWQFTF
jgi:hypothetical protein